jgi:hypothetical protein
MEIKMEDDVKEEIKEVEEKLANAPFEIEIEEEKVEEPPQEEPEVEEEPEPEEKPDEEFSKRVQKRISTLVQQRKQAEADAETARGEVNSLKSRLDRLEAGNSKQAQQNFQERYESARAALQTAIEEGNTEAQVEHQETLADMRAAIRVAEMQRQQQSTQAVSPTVGRAAQVAQDPTPQKAIHWWQQNNWFNANGFERETAAARAIDVQLDLEGFDKHDNQYYDELNARLKKMFPELISGGKVEQQPKTRAKSSNSPVAPTAGGPSRKQNRVKLSKDQLQMARELGLTDEQALKHYANEINSIKETQNG